MMDIDKHSIALSTLHKVCTRVVKIGMEEYCDFQNQLEFVSTHRLQNENFVDTKYLTAPPSSRKLERLDNIIEAYGT